MLLLLYETDIRQCRTLIERSKAGVALCCTLPHSAVRNTEPYCAVPCCAMTCIAALWLRCSETTVQSLI